MNSLTLGATYYFMRNVQGAIEVNFGLLGKDAASPPYVGHLSREHYLLFGPDAAF